MGRRLSPTYCCVSTCVYPRLCVVCRTLDSEQIVIGNSYTVMIDWQRVQNWGGVVGGCHKGTIFNIRQVTYTELGPSQGIELRVPMY